MRFNTLPIYLPLYWENWNFDYPKFLGIVARVQLLAQITISSISTGDKNLATRSKTMKQYYNNCAFIDNLCLIARGSKRSCHCWSSRGCESWSHWLLAAACWSTDTWKNMITLKKSTPSTITGHVPATNLVESPGPCCSNIG